MLIRAKWVMPVAGEPIENGEVLAVDGRIVSVGPAGHVSSESAGEIVELRSSALLPGFVNAHSHLELTVMRGLLEDLGFREWITRLTSVKYSILGDEDMLDSARLGALEALSAGVTMCGDTCDSGLALDALLEAGMRGTVFQEVFGPDMAQAPESMRKLTEKVDALRERAGYGGRVRVGISPHAPYTVSGELFRRTTAFALERNLPVAIHAAESDDEERFVREGTGPFAEGLARRAISWEAPRTSTIAYLASLGVLETRPLLIHAVRATLADLDLVAASGACIAHCPKSNAKLGHGAAPLREMLDRAIVVGLGTDSVASNNVCDPIDEARCAVMSARTRAGDFRALSSRTALELSTLGGARALGRDLEVGTIEPGKRADLCAVSLDGLHHAPVYDVEAAIVFSATARDVVMTVVDGRILYDARGETRFPHADEERLRRRMIEIRDRIVADLGSG
jgi:cytosine/adenosine deaminase-related metal-dependent hydrolase